MCSIDVMNLGFSESTMLAEVGNKALQHNFDVLNPKILVTKLDFYSNALICIQQNECRLRNFIRKGKCVSIFQLRPPMSIFLQLDQTSDLISCSKKGVTPKDSLESVSRKSRLACRCWC